MQLFLSLLIPVLAHGLYDYYCTVGTLFATIALYVFLLFLYIYCFRRIKKMSKDDMLDNTYSNILVLRKHPHLTEVIKEKY